MFRAKGGFDIVIGNPPYVLIQDMDIPEAIKEYYKTRYEVAAYKVDLYHLFIEKGCRLLHNNSVIAYITPSNFATNNYCKTLREYFLNNLSVKHFIFYDENVFQANVNNAVFVGQRTANTKGNMIRVAKGKRQGNTWDYSDASSLQQSFYMQDDYLIVLGNSFAAVSVLQKIEQGSLELKQYANVNFGMQLRNRKLFPMDVVVGNSGLTEYHKPCYTGKDIVEYGSHYNDLYCYFNTEAKCGGCWDVNAQLANPKLLVRQIGLIPVVGIDENGYAVLNTAFMISGFRDSISPYYLLGLLNSEVLKFYWLQKFSDGRKQFPKIKGTYLEKLPIRRSLEGENSVSELVKKIMIANPDDRAELVVEMNALIYDIYGLSQDEINTVSAELTKIAE